MPDKSRLLSLMARKEKLALSHAAQEVGRLARQQEQNDAYATQLKSMIHSDDPLKTQDRVTTKAQLTSDHWFDSQIAAQLEEIREKSDEMEHKMTQAVNHMAHVEARVSNYTQKAQIHLRHQQSLIDERRLNQIIDADL